MTTSLSQSVGNAPPQLPGNTTLKADSADDAGVLIHDLGSTIATLHTRLMLKTDSASAGTVAVCGGIDGDGMHAWQVTLDAATPSVTLAIGEDQASVDLASSIAWHTLEVGLDSAGGSATLRIDGIERATLSTTISATRYAWLGGAFRSAALSGSIELDHWVLADAPIGLPIAPPEFDHGGDPRRWLVIYNRNSSESAQWADAYRARRDVPYVNLCGLDLPTSETASAAEFESMRQQLNDYLDDNAMRGLIVGVLLGFDVPGYADVDAQGSPTPIASYLHTDDTHGSIIVNPLYQSPITNRPSASDYASARLTGRIDAPTLADALALLDRADQLATQPLAHDQLAEVVIDTNPDNVNIGPFYTDAVDDWANDGGLSTLRLPFTVYDASAPASVSGESLVWGWREAAPPTGFFATPAGRRAICLQLDPEPEPADSVRTTSTDDWLTAAIASGYAAAAAPSRDYSISSIPLPHLFFEALRLGWTLAEAWAVAPVFLRDGLQIIGDPLMQGLFPKAGYDVFGPADRTDQIDLDTPLAQLHDGQREYTLDPADVPPANSASRYLVRRIDDQGRADLASSIVYAAVEAGQVIQPAMPAWPTDEGWALTRRDSAWVATALWPASLRSLGIDSITLQSQVGVDDPIDEQQATPTSGQRSVSFMIDPPDQTTRYRLQITQGPATYDTPWSQWFDPASTPSDPLTLLESCS